MRPHQAGAARSADNGPFPAVFLCISAVIEKFDGDIRSPESILRTLEEPPYVPACQDSCQQKLREEMYLIGSRDLAAYRDMLCHAEAWLEAAQQYPRLTIPTSDLTSASTFSP